MCAMPCFGSRLDGKPPCSCCNAAKAASVCRTSAMRAQLLAATPLCRCSAAAAAALPTPRLLLSLAPSFQLQGAIVGAGLSQGHSTTLGIDSGLFRRFQASGAAAAATAAEQMLQAWRSAGAGPVPARASCIAAAGKHCVLSGSCRRMPHAEPEGQARFRDGGCSYGRGRGILGPHWRPPICAGGDCLLLAAGGLDAASACRSFLGGFMCQ